jgi:hypothetical protein
MPTPTGFLAAKLSALRQFANPQTLRIFFCPDFMPFPQSALAGLLLHRHLLSYGRNPIKIRQTSPDLGIHSDRLAMARPEPCIVALEPGTPAGANCARALL